MAQKTFRFGMLREGAVIVASILLALGADAWWDSRQEESRRRNLLQDLAGEFGSVREQLESDVDLLDDMTDRARALRTASGARTPLPQDSITYLALGVVTGIPLTPVLPRYEAAIASGELSLLADDALRVALADFDATRGFIDQLRELSGEAFFIGPMHDLRQELGSLSVLNPFAGQGLPPERFIPPDLNELIQRRSVYAAVEPVYVLKVNAEVMFQQALEAANQVLREIERLEPGSTSGLRSTNDSG